jgi:signal transduction histidine kinase
LEGLAALLRREAQKRDRLLNELRRFTADASHELRTPLTAIRTVGEIALRKGQTDPAHLTETIGSMLEEAQRMNALVERLLRLARVESENLIIKPLDINVESNLIEWRDSVAVLAEEKGVRLRAEARHDLHITTDRELLGDAVANLLHNAIQHAPPGSVVSLAGRESANDTIAIDVTDQGPGIAPEHHDRIFERFYRVDTARSRSEGGFGLGLCIAKTSVERLGGTIGLRTTQANGTTFTITLAKRFIRQD